MRRRDFIVGMLASTSLTPVVIDVMAMPIDTTVLTEHWFPPVQELVRIYGTDAYGRHIQETIPVGGMTKQSFSRMTGMAFLDA